jgi:hypothetical protein
MDYKQKYLKYKEKYLRLKAELEGGVIYPEFVKRDGSVNPTYVKQSNEKNKDIYYILYQESDGTNIHLFNAIENRLTQKPNVDKLTVIKEVFNEKLKILQNIKEGLTLNQDIKIIKQKNKDGSIETKSLKKYMTNKNVKIEVESYGNNKKNNLYHIVISIQ